MYVVKPTNAQSLGNNKFSILSIRVGSAIILQTHSQTQELT
jgi:hypothetical protein